MSLSNAQRTEDTSRPWREVVRTAANEAATIESRARRKNDKIPFNYRWEHVQAVVRLAIRLAEQTGADREVVEAAAWLHDVAKGGSRDHGRDGAIAARRILTQTDFVPAKIEAVADAIAKHVGLYTDQPVEPLEAAVLWDADKLTKLGATAILHFTGYALIRDEGTTEQMIEWLPDVDWQQATVHSLHTAPARAAGQARLETYRAFCRQLAIEFDGQDLVADPQTDDDEV